MSSPSTASANKAQARRRKTVNFMTGGERVMIPGIYNNNNLSTPQAQRDPNVINNDGERVTSP